MRFHTNPQGIFKSPNRSINALEHTAVRHDIKKNTIKCFEPGDNEQNDIDQDSNQNQIQEEVASPLNMMHPSSDDDMPLTVYNAKSPPVYLTSPENVRNVQETLWVNTQQQTPALFVVGAPRYPHMSTVPKRWASFSKFPRNILIPHEQMAIAGFFSTGKMNNYLFIRFVM